jgi:YD repeat-containing protein
MPSTWQGPRQQTLRVFYDSECNAIAVERPDRTALRITRGPLNQIRTLDVAGQARWTAEYDAWARPIRCQKQGYEPAQLEYDGAGRLQAIARPGGDRVRLGYTPGGRLVSIETPLRRFQFVFDPVGRLQSLMETTGSKRDAFDYDEANRLVRRSSPGWTEQYQYDRARRVVTWTVTDLSPRRCGFRYNEAGWVEEIAYPNGTHSTFDYDAAQRLTRLSTKDGSNRALATMAVDYATSARLASATGGGSDRFAYHYDSNLFLRETLYPDGHRDFFAYDPQGGLLSTTSTARRETFGRDALGRPTEVGKTRYVYLAPNDPTPAMTSATVCLTLDDREQVVALRRGDGLKAQYAYLADGRMVRREIAGRVVWFDWDGPRLRSLHDERGRLLASIHYDPTFGLPLAVVIGNQTYFCHPDAFGRVALLTDEKGKAIDPPKDFPFDVKGRGEAPIVPTWEGLPPAIRLPEENLHLVRGRLCDLRSGDFLSPDLAHYVGRENPYRARMIARPLELTATWDDLSNVIGWIEQIEKPQFERRISDCGGRSADLGFWISTFGLQKRNAGGGLPLSEMVSLVRRLEEFDSHLFDVALRHELDPDRWLEWAQPVEALGQGLGRMVGIPLCGWREPCCSAAAAFSEFSPLGPIPYDGNVAQSGR